MMDYNRKGCLLALGFCVSFWSWFIMAFVDLRSYVGAAIGLIIILISFFIIRKEKDQISKKYIFNTFNLAYITGMLINLVNGVSIGNSIISTFTMLLAGMILFFRIH